MAACNGRFAVRGFDLRADQRARGLRPSVEAALLAVLDSVRGGCGIAAAPGNRWASDERLLWYQTPWVDDRHFFEFGFDFDREDEAWSVARLALARGAGLDRGDDPGEADRPRSASRATRWSRSTWSSF